MSREAEALRQWLLKAWELRGDVEYVVRKVEAGAPMAPAVQVLDRLFGGALAKDAPGLNMAVSVEVDSLLPGAPRGHSQPKPRGSGRV